jgi:hypothetical protein
MDSTVIGYLLFTVLLIGLIAFYVNKPTLFTVLYFRLPRPVKWLFAFSCGFLLVLFAGATWLPMGALMVLMIGFALEKQERFAFIKLRT